MQFRKSCVAYSFLLEVLQQKAVRFFIYKNKQEKRNLPRATAYGLLCKAGGAGVKLGVYPARRSQCVAAVLRKRVATQAEGLSIFKY